MRFRLRTLLIVLALGPPILAVGWWLWVWNAWPLLPLGTVAVLFVGATIARIWAGLAASADGDEGFLAVMYTIVIAAASLIAGLFIAFRIYMAFGDFPALYGGMQERTPRVAADFSIAVAVGAVPGALLFWLTWPRQYRTARTGRGAQVPCSVSRSATCCG